MSTEPAPLGLLLFAMVMTIIGIVMLLGAFAR